MKGIKYSAREKAKALHLWLDDKHDIMWVAKRFKCTIQSLYRWKRQYDGTLASLENGSDVPLTPHPNAHTPEETACIKQMFEENPDISYAEAYGRLRVERGYSRTYFGFWRFVVKHNLRPAEEVREFEKYRPLPYFTPEMLGVKWQMDVKYVPRECNLDKEYTEWYYQYTMIDEATRERFIYPYQDHCGQSTCDFIQRAIVYFGYAPQIIQTDNGAEFTMPKIAKKTTVHIVDKLLAKLKIQHQLIRAHTPRHNGKVERSHRTDQECFYDHLHFSTFEELKEKMAEWLIRYNNRPHSSLRNRAGKRVWYTPLQKRAELLEDLKNLRDEYKIRFLRGRRERASIAA